MESQHISSYELSKPLKERPEQTHPKALIGVEMQGGGGRVRADGKEEGRETGFPEHISHY